MEIAGVSSASPRVTTDLVASGRRGCRASLAPSCQEGDGGGDMDQDNAGDDVRSRLGWRTSLTRFPVWRRRSPSSSTAARSPSTARRRAWLGAGPSWFSTERVGRPTRSHAPGHNMTGILGRRRSGILGRRRSRRPNSPASSRSTTPRASATRSRARSLAPDRPLPDEAGMAVRTSAYFRPGAGAGIPVAGAVHPPLNADRVRGRCAGRSPGGRSCQ